ncbi:hypothetical protein [Paraburkholderia bryophila]|uniref:Uncharacterized protein n=1 Tax=Paraburkholderia bryophila TaxID=420952 RepID=A0A7Y9WS40_9BURK|nr:hypothetical protein [Paraburkholderia bryophila]NYH26067.1 hypothetical protein [Paraburkholderia bryophila]
METFNTNDDEFGRKLALPHIGKCLVGLLGCVLADVVTDIEVAARDLQISDPNFVRLRRAMDRLSCAQPILETLRAESTGAEDGAEATRESNEVAIAGVAICRIFDDKTSTT